jgi:hypothetical protein
VAAFEGLFPLLLISAVSVVHGDTEQRRDTVKFPRAEERWNAGCRGCPPLVQSLRSGGGTSSPGIQAIKQLRTIASAVTFPQHHFAHANSHGASVVQRLLDRLIVVQLFK